MSLIEQAAKRLQELRRVGIDVSKVSQTSPDGAANNDGATKTLSPPRHERESRAASSDASLTTSPPEAAARQVTLDLTRLAACNVMTPDAPRSRLADDFRVIKRPLITNASRTGAAGIRNGNLIMVTSALPGEGKSFTAANLAMSIAMEMDHTVLLVDADVAHPALPQMLGIPSAPGMLDRLVNDSLDLGQLLFKTNVENLSVLPSGKPHPRATELLASEAMSKLLEEMAQRYSDRIIIFDSPPLLVTTEARVLAAHMGQTVMVVQADRTTHAAVQHALATIASCPVKLMMLNMGRARAHDDYGYSYGNYAYGT